MAIKFLNTATAATQAVGDNSTKIATTAYVDAAASAIPIGNYLPLAGGTMNTNAAITMSGSLTTSANVYAQRFYDQGDNAFYGDFAGTSQFNHVRINSVLGTQSFVSGSYGWQFEQSTTTADPVTFRFDNQKYRVYAGGGAGEIMTFLEGGNVGIGNTNPSSALSISKSMGAAFIADFINPAVNGHGLLIQAGGTTGTRYITQWKDALGTERFHMEDDGEAYFQGNVGIGTTSPDAKLDIEAATNPTIRLTNSTNPLGSADVGTLEFFTKDTSTQASRVLSSIVCVNEANSPSVPDGQLAFKTSLGGANAQPATEKMRIDPVGNVGIGTASPGHKLEVNGNVKADYALLGRGFRAANRGELHLNGTSTTDVAEMFFGYGDGFTEANIRWGISDRGTTDGRLIFYRGPANGGFLSALELKDNLDVIVPNGKVGVGTTAPAARLHVKEPSGSTSQIKMSAASNEANYGYLTMTDNTVNTAKLTFGTTYGYNTPVDAMTVWNGMVGIGTASPDQKLHIKGGDIQTQDTTGSNGVLRIRATITGTPSTGGYPSVGAGDAVIEGGGTTQRQPGVITLMNGDSSISSGQDLGVIQFLGKDDSSNGYCTSQIVSTTSGAMGSGASGGGILRFLTASGSTGSAVEERMRINNSGRVMIGTTTSTSNANLTVKESLAIQSGSNTVLSIFTGYGSSFINTGTSGGTVRFGAPTSYTTNVYVQGTIEAVSSVQMGNNSAAASAANAGSTRYRVSGNNSYMDMSMRTGATTYAWVNIVQNNW